MAGVNTEGPRTIAGPRDLRFEKCLNCGAIFGRHHYETRACPILVNMERVGWKTTVFKSKADVKEV